MSLFGIWLIIFAIVIVVSLIIIFLYTFRTNNLVQKSHERAWNQLLAGGFRPDKIYQRTVSVAGTGNTFPYNYLAVDMTQGLCALEYRVFSMTDIVKIEMLNDSTVVQSAASKFGGGGLLGVVVPGVAGFGGGSQSHSGEKVAVVAIRVTLDNRQQPSVMIPFLFGVAEKASNDYQTAMSRAYEIYGILEGYVRFRDAHAPAEKQDTSQYAAQADLSGVCAACGAPLVKGAKFCNACGAAAVVISEKVAGQLQRLEQFLDEGVLTQEEYDAKKKMLLETAQG